ncbi:MAG TPA: hypothetical protein DHW38_04130 [Planctomycetaceae bacterium]|nr:LysM peptidoglycan-binding domain-containing protein [Pirellulales bacterium]HCK70744.1 hypothetical protein [Planctomycetaceae bacterium]HCP84744.1 hypothetical protein [Planctomycetaceae bacterium]
MKSNLMTKSVTNVMNPLAILMMLLVGSLVAQEPTTQDSGPGRPLTVGVLKTVAPDVHDGDTVSLPGPLMELAKGRAHLDWQPTFTPKSRTLLARAQSVQMRHPIWGLEFSYKPLRMLDVDIPQTSGKMMRKTIWYMVYRVRYLGGELHPVFDRSKPYAVDINRADPSNPNPLRYEKYKVVRKQQQFRYFMPHMILRSHRLNKEYLDQIIPVAIDEIKKEENLNGKLLNTVEMSGTKIPLEDLETGKGVWGVATWEDVDPRSDYLSLYIQGLTNAYRFTDTAADFAQGEPLGKGRILELKTLQVNFYRPGDTRDLSEDVIYEGMPTEVVRPNILYTIQQGDNLKFIAHRFLSDQTRWQEIHQTNTDIITNPEKLEPGRVIRLPRRFEYSDLQATHLHITEEGETVQVIGQLYQVQEKSIRAINTDLMASDNQPTRGQIVLVPINLRRLQLPDNVDEDFFKVYTLRQAEIMKLYGMKTIDGSQWMFSGVTGSISRNSDDLVRESLPKFEPMTP